MDIWDILESNTIFGTGWIFGIFSKVIRYLAQGGIGSVLIDRPTNLPGLKHFQANFKVSKAVVNIFEINVILLVSSVKI